MNEAITTGDLVVATTTSAFIFTALSLSHPPRPRRSQCELIETPFARRLDASLIDVLVKLRSIPGFLAQITLDLFNRQTMTVHRH